jgi:hypothetical protein
LNSWVKLCFCCSVIVFYKINQACYFHLNNTYQQINHTSFLMKDEFFLIFESRLRKNDSCGRLPERLSALALSWSALAVIVIFRKYILIKVCSYTYVVHLGSVSLLPSLPPHVLLLLVQSLQPVSENYQ